MLAAKPDTMSSILVIHKVERTDSCKLYYDMHTQTHTEKESETERRRDGGETQVINKCVKI